MNTIKEETYKEHIIRIFQDESPESPNDWGNTDCFLVYEHRQFQVEREGFKPSDIFKHIAYTKGVREYGECYNETFNNYYMFQVNAYIHSGVVLSLGNEYPFNDRWDVSTTGFVLITKEDTTQEQAKQQAENLIETWNKYLSGEVYGFKILRKIEFYKVDKEAWDNGGIMPQQVEDCAIIFDEELIDGCGGYYNEPDEIIKECKSIIDSYETI